MGKNCGKSWAGVLLCCLQYKKKEEKINVLFFYYLGCQSISRQIYFVWISKRALLGRIGVLELRHWGDLRILVLHQMVSQPPTKNAHALLSV